MSGLALSPSSWRGEGQGVVSHHLGHSAYDPAQSFAYTSAYSGRPTSTLLASADSLGGPPDGVLTRELLHEGLTDLGRVGDGTKLSYLTLSLSAFSLTDISLLSSYPHIQRLNLASNNLTDLLSLSNLPHLVYLDVSHNKLTTILDFHPPPKNLQEANYSHNEIEEICDLSPHCALSKLILDCNQIAEIRGLCSLSRLKHLSLADNRIERISNLNHLPIKFLRLSGNGIKVIENLGTLAHLQVIDLSGNNISSLRGLEGHAYLTEINMEDNQVVDVKEVVHIKDLQMLNTLNLSNNPVETLMDYRPLMVFYLPSLLSLDGRKVLPKEKVAATNRFSPPLEVVASQDHRTNVTGAAHKAARIRYSTLTQVTEPYPMLVLCGPPGSGKGYFCKLLVEEFPRFFGLGVAHTTRHLRGKEIHGRDYYYTETSTFTKAIKYGEFVQTHRLYGHNYGLTMGMIEQVAQQGLACVTHMSLEGVLSLKKTHFEPRYILTMPLTPQVHKERLLSKGCYSNEEIKKAMNDVEVCKQIHLERPGFFDTAINTDSLKEGYYQLRALVMAYGDITPETPLSFSSSTGSSSSSSSGSTHSSSGSSPSGTSSGSSCSDSATTPCTTMDHTPSQPRTDTHTPSAVDPFEMDTEGTPKRPTYQPVTPEVVKRIHDAARSWNQHSSAGTSHSNPASRPLSRLGTPASEFGRKHSQIKAALAGKVASFPDSSASRPDTGMSQPRTKVMPHGRSSVSTSDDERSISASTLSKLSYERDLRSPVGGDVEDQDRPDSALSNNTN